VLRLINFAHSEVFMFGTFAVAWVVVYYITQAKYPIEGIGPWNMGIGFGLITTAFVLSTRWK